MPRKTTKPLTPGTPVWTDDRYWAEPEGGRPAEIEEHWPMSDLYLIRPFKSDGTPLHYRCTIPTSLVSPVEPR